MTLIGFIVALASMATCLAQVQRLPAAPSAEEDSLKKFLQEYLKDPYSIVDNSPLYLNAFVDLNGDGKKEAIVYLMGREWCGSGGCNTLILLRDGGTWKVFKNITISRPPIRVLSSTSHGWHDITVVVAGGGILQAYEAELSFDGKNYPGNPSVPPARRVIRKVAGKVVITSMEGGTPLYP